MFPPRPVTLKTDDTGRRLEARLRIRCCSSLSAASLLFLVQHPSLSRALLFASRLRLISEADAEQRLLELIDGCGKTLGLPPVLAQAVGSSEDPGSGPVDRLRRWREERRERKAGRKPAIRLTDPLEIVTVLSKTSGGVYIADRLPDLALACKSRRVELLIPFDWSRP